MACPRRAAAARLRPGGSRIGTNARKQPSPARGSSHAPDHCAVGVLMHPPVTDVGVRLLALSHAVTLRTRDCCPALSLPLSVFAAALGLRVATVFTLCVYSIVVIVFTPLCLSHTTLVGKKAARVAWVDHGRARAEMGGAGEPITPKAQSLFRGQRHAR